MVESADIVICGAGIAGIAAAYYLTEQGLTDIVLVDRRAPLTLTSDKSGENYRNWWPHSAMAHLMNHSIDLIEDLARSSNNAFSLSRRGYAYVSAHPDAIALAHQNHERFERLDLGPFRFHDGQDDMKADPYRPAAFDGFEGQPCGADYLLDRQLIRQHYPFLAEDVQTIVHARRAGWFSAQQLGMFLLEEAKKRGLRERRADVVSIKQDDKGISALEIVGAEGIVRMQTRTFINAAGPYLPHIGAMLGLSLPVDNVLHQKIAMRDPLGVVPRDAPFLIFTDPQQIAWTEEERGLWEQEPDYRWFLGAFPGGLHVRPEGGRDSEWIKLGWAFNHQACEPVDEPAFDPEFPEIILRGASRFIPGLQQYSGNIPGPLQHYGGYYTKTKENLPLIGPSGVEGAYLIGALSGFGVMAACGAGEILSQWVAGGEVPPYAHQFSLARYDDPVFVASLDTMTPAGEL